MITITYISKDRASHLKRSIQSLFSQTVLPEHIVIADCSDDRVLMEKTIDELMAEGIIPITYIWEHKSKLNRAQGRNLGRQYVETPLAVSTESDILFPPTLIEECIRMFGNPIQKLFVQPYKAYQNEDGTITDRRMNDDNGFFQAYRVIDFDNIGGYNPFLFGWGHEDKDFTIRIKWHGCRYKILPLYVEHIWHKSVQKMEEYNNNLRISQNSYWDNNKKVWIKFNE